MTGSMDTWTDTGSGPGWDNLRGVDTCLIVTNFDNFEDARAAITDPEALELLKRMQRDELDGAIVTSRSPDDIRVENLGITYQQYASLLAQAPENLPTDTTVAPEDIDAILTWVLPAYRDMLNEAAAGFRPLRGGPSGRHPVLVVQDQTTAEGVLDAATLVELRKRQSVGEVIALEIPLDALLPDDPRAVVRDTTTT